MPISINKKLVIIVSQYPTNNLMKQSRKGKKLIIVNCVIEAFEIRLL